MVVHSKESNRCYRKQTFQSLRHSTHSVDFTQVQRQVVHVQTSPTMKTLEQITLTSVTIQVASSSCIVPSTTAVLKAVVTKVKTGAQAAHGHAFHGSMHKDKFQATHPQLTITNGTLTQPRLSSPSAMKDPKAETPLSSLTILPVSTRHTMPASMQGLSQSVCMDLHGEQTIR